MIEPSVEKSNQEVIQHRQDPRAAQGVVGTDVSHDGNF